MTDEAAIKIEDSTGYDSRVKKRSYAIPTAFSLMALGISISSFLNLLPATQGADEQIIARGLDKFVSLLTKDILDLSFSQSHIISSLAMISCLIIALVILRYSSDDNKNFQSAYPYLEDFYTPEEKASARKHGCIFMACSLVFLVLFVVGLITNASVHSMIVRGFSYLALAIALWLLLHGIIWWRRVDIFAYNYRALDDINIYELQANKEIPHRAVMISEKKLRAPLRTAKRVIVLTGCLISLCLYFLPSLETPFYWVAIVIALLISKCISLYSEQKAKNLAEGIDD